MSVLFLQTMYIRSDTMKPKLFGIQIWWYPTFLLTAWQQSQQGRKFCKVRKQQKKFQFCQSYSYVNRKVSYHQIWIPNNLGFIVSDLMYFLSISCANAWNVSLVCNSRQEFSYKLKKITNFSLLSIFSLSGKIKIQF